MPGRQLIDIACDVLIPHAAELRVRTATLADLLYVTDRAQKHAKTMGWLPHAAIEEAIQRRFVWMATIDDQPAGHVLVTGGHRSPACLRHNCVEEELWCKGVGSAFVAIYQSWCFQTSPHTTCTVRTRQDITAQNIINVKSGARAIRVDAPRPSAGRNGVVTWSWDLRQRRRRAAPVRLGGTVTSPAGSEHAVIPAALPH